MKRKSASIFWGIMFILGGFVGLAQYGILVALICFVIGVLLLFPFKKKEESAESQTPATASALYRDVKSNSFSVAGVTFSNESGKLRSRQTILRKILFNDPPFDGDHVVTLEKYTYEGEPAYYVKVNDYIIGNVPKEFVPYVDANFDRPYKIEDFEVYGGGNGKKYGASLKMVYLDTIEN